RSHLVEAEVRFTLEVEEYRFGAQFAHQDAVGSGDPAVHRPHWASVDKGHYRCAGDIVEWGLRALGAQRAAAIVTAVTRTVTLVFVTHCAKGPFFDFLCRTALSWTGY